MTPQFETSPALTSTTPWAQRTSCADCSWKAENQLLAPTRPDPCLLTSRADCCTGFQVYLKLVQGDALRHARLLGTIFVRRSKQVNLALRATDQIACIDVAAIDELLAGQQLPCRQSVLDHWQRFIVRFHTAGDGDVGDQVRLVFIIRFRDLQLVPYPGLLPLLAVSCFFPISFI